MNALSNYEFDEIKSLLVEIRDGQREHVAEYKRVTTRSLELQERAVSRTEQMGTLYRRMVVITGYLILFIIGLIIYLLAKLR